MNFFDILTIVVLIWAVISGWRSGFISQLFGLIGIILSIVLSLRYGAALGEALHIDERFAVVAGFLIIFVSTLIIVTIAAHLLSKALSFIGLSWVNILLGILLAIIKGLIVLNMLYAAIYTLNNNIQFLDPSYFNNSISFDIIRKCAKPLLEFWNDAKQTLLTSQTL